MMAEQLEFNLAEGERAKVIGMALAANARQASLEIARQFAREIALSRSSRECTSDDVRRMLIDRGYSPSLGPGMGSLFKGGGWEATGALIKSAVVSNHARLLYVWRLK